MASPGELLNQMLVRYFQGDIGGASQIASLLVSKKAKHFLPSYILALCGARSGNVIQAKTLMHQAESHEPSLSKYDLFKARLRQQGREDWLSIHEARLKTWLEFQNIQSFLISFPKCGRTWVRYMLGLLGRKSEDEDPLEILNMSQRHNDLPITEISHDDYPQWIPSTDIMTDKSIYRGKNVVLLVRDPLDVVVSHYFQFTKRDIGADGSPIHKDDFSGSLSEFVWRDIGALRSIVVFYNSWAKARTVPKTFTLATYEALTQDTAAEMKGILKGLSWPSYDDEKLEKVIQESSFERMRELEEKQSLNNMRLRPIDPNDPDSYKLRSGKVGGYVDHFDPAEIAPIRAYLDEHLDPFFQMYKS